MLKFIFAVRQCNGNSYKISYINPACVGGCQPCEREKVGRQGRFGKIILIRNLTMQRVTPLERRQENRTAIGRYRAAMLEMMA